MSIIMLVVSLLLLIGAVQVEDRISDISQSLWKLYDKGVLSLDSRVEELRLRLRITRASQLGAVVIGLGLLISVFIFFH